MPIATKPKQHESCKRFPTTAPLLLDLFRPRACCAPLLQPAPPPSRMQRGMHGHITAPCHPATSRQHIRLFLSCAIQAGRRLAQPSVPHPANLLPLAPQCPAGPGPHSPPPPSAPRTAATGRGAFTAQCVPARKPPGAGTTGFHPHQRPRALSTPEAPP